MINSFDTDVAMDVGINAAIIYKNIQYWCEKNRTNEQNEHDGYYWTYNSISAFCEQFPYLSEKQIRKALADLEEAGYIKTANYNKLAYDRTKWYADCKLQKESMHTDKREVCICPTGQMELPSRANEVAPEGEPIPDIKPNNNTNDYVKKESKKKESGYDAIMDSVSFIKNDPELRESIVSFIKMRKMIKKPLTDDALKLNINKAYKLAKGDPVTMKAIFEQSVMNSWQGVFELKEETDQKRPAVKKAAVNPFTELRRQLGYDTGTDSSAFGEAVGQLPKLQG